MCVFPVIPARERLARPVIRDDEPILEELKEAEMSRQAEREMMMGEDDIGTLAV